MVKSIYEWLFFSKARREWEKEEAESFKLWRTKIYPEGVDEYNRLVAKGLEENRKWLEKTIKGSVDD
jgi:hypothetical protein|tara:strand:- start:2239 stop:2439 length:201 start_codon:yes stop_codon:yes gene_type:complete